MSDAIDWVELRRRIALTPVIVPPKHVKRPNRSPESIERRRASGRIRSKKRYWNNREHCLFLQREWEKENPEKVKAKRKRYYENHKDDPEWMEHHRQKNREYKARKMERDKAQKAMSNIV